MPKYILLNFQLQGFNIKVEYKANVDRIDAIIKTETATYIFEFKLDKSTEEELAQIEDKNYYERFVGQGKLLYLIGANFTSGQKNIDNYLVKEVN